VTFEIDINGRTRSVVVEPDGAGPDGGRFRVLVEGEPFDVTLTVTDLGVSLVYASDGRVVDVAATERPGGEWLLQFPHVTLAAAVDGRRFRRGSAGSVADAGEQRIMAPMPGRVVRVLVKTGDDVAGRQGLVVVEAMKMENELVSPRAGRIKEVAVAEGQSVETGRLLIVVE
jgi:biotin carboxyl carrier protein